MKEKLLRPFRGDGLRGRALRGAAQSVAGVGGQQVLRLASNLVLTRLLFPEAFGLMALVQVFLNGLQMFSDLGIRASIIQNERGDEEDFLNTAWTVQILRGFALWLGACALAWPAAVFYEEPMIMWLLPVVGFNSVIRGFTSTNVASANRHIRLGRLVSLELISQLVGLIVMIGAAAIWNSVWSLVLGSIISSVVGAVLSHTWMPGIRNRLCWDRAAVSDLLRFGQYIFLSTLITFFVNEGDKLILGRFISLANLAFYNMAYFLANVPNLVSNIVVERVIFPIYRNLRPSEGADNRKKIGTARYLLTGTTMTMTGILAIFGDHLIQFLYDSRYYSAGPMLVLFSLSRLPLTITATYGRLLLAEGNSRNFAAITFVTGALKLGGMIAGFYFLGISGVILANALVGFGIYPVQFWFISRYQGTDLRHDLIYLGYAALILAVATAVNQTALAEMLTRDFLSAPFHSGTWDMAG